MTNGTGSPLQRSAHPGPVRTSRELDRFGMSIRWQLGGFLARRTSEEHVAELLKAGAVASGDHDRDWDDEIDRIAASSPRKPPRTPL